jgi:hypothetical protein
VFRFPRDAERMLRGQLSEAARSELLQFGSLQFFLTSHPPPDRKQCCEIVTIVFFAADDFFKNSQPANPKNNSDLRISKS